MQLNTISPIIHNTSAFFSHVASPLLSPSLHASLFPIICSSGLSVEGVVFPAMVILPAWPVWPAEPVDSAIGLAADSMVRCAMAAQRLLSWPLRWRLRDFSHVPPKGSERTCWQSRANKSFLITDSARNRHRHMHTHTLALTDLEDGAVEWFATPIPNVINPLNGSEGCYPHSDGSNRQYHSFGF